MVDWSNKPFVWEAAAQENKYKFARFVMQILKSDQQTTEQLFNVSHQMIRFAEEGPLWSSAKLHVKLVS